MAKESKTDTLQRSIGRLEGTVTAIGQHVEVQGGEIKEVQKHLATIGETLVNIGENLKLHMKRSDQLEALVELTKEDFNVRLRPFEKGREKLKFSLKVINKAAAIVVASAGFAWASIQIYGKLKGIW